MDRTLPLPRLMGWTGAGWKAGPRGFAAAIAGVLVGTAVVLSAPSAQAQQFVTDDAWIVGYGACQVEAWHGEVSSWIQPACQPIRNLEITAGPGFPFSDGERETRLTLEGKVLLREGNGRSPAVSVVVGTEAEALSQLYRERPPLLFAYVPVTTELVEDRFLLHLNLGLESERREEEAGNGGEATKGSRRAATGAARADLVPPIAAERVTLVAELYGEAEGRPGYQLGIRGSLIPERLLLDVSYGGHTAAEESGRGWTIGVGWTPPSFF
jgi:hypothetical protein